MSLNAGLLSVVGVSGKIRSIYSFKVLESFKVMNSAGSCSELLTGIYFGIIVFNHGCLLLLEHKVMVIFMTVQ